jgi:hypothetical protein
MYHRRTSLAHSSDSDFSTAHEELSRIVKEIERRTREEQIKK